MKKLFSEIPCIKGERITIKKLTPDCANGLRELTEDDEVYRFLPAALFERRYDADCVIERLYGECLKESLILGVFSDGEFCGLAEIYGYNEPLSKANVGFRALKRYWGRGIASEASALLIDYLFSETDIKTIGASVMSENKASEKVLKKLGFERLPAVEYEDWGLEELTLADKWILKK